jgi:hypothetical protein
MCETIASKTLYSAAFMVNANQQIFSNSLDVCTQSRELRTALPIASKQNETTRQRVFQAFFVDRCERKAFNVDDERCLDIQSVFSTMQ